MKHWLSRRNFGLKVFSLLIAVVLSYFVNSETNSSVVGFISPIEIKNLAADRIIIWPLTRQAQITIKGPSFLVSQIAASPPLIKLNIPQDVSNRYVASISARDLALPPAIQVLSISPGELELTLDTLASKDVPVIAPRIGQLPEGFKLDSIEIDPSNIEINGPQNEIKDILSVETAPLDLRDVKESFRRRVPLRIGGGLVRAKVETVVVKVSISVEQDERKFKGLPIEIRSMLGEKIAVVPEKVNVEISAPRDKLANITPVSILPYIKVGQRELQSGEVKVGVELPQGVQLVVVEPEVVKISNKMIRGSENKGR